MNLKDLHDKLEDMLLETVDPADIKVLVHIGGGERAPINSVNLAIKTPADEEKGYDEDEEYWNWEDGAPKQGVHFDSVDQLTIVIDAEE